MLYIISTKKSIRIKKIMMYFMGYLKWGCVFKFWIDQRLKSCQYSPCITVCFIHIWLTYLTIKNLTDILFWLTFTIKCHHKLFIISYFPFFRCSKWMQNMSETKGLIQTRRQNIQNLQIVLFTLNLSWIKAIPNCILVYI